MKGGAFRKILLVVAGSVFLFSSGMVLKHRLEMHASAEYTDSVARMVITPVGQRENHAAEETGSASSGTDSLQAAEGNTAESSVAAITQDAEENTAESSAAAITQAAEENTAESSAAAITQDAEGNTTESSAAAATQAAEGNTAESSAAAATQDAEENTAEFSAAAAMQAAEGMAAEAAAPAPEKKTGSIRKSSEIAPIQVDFDALCAENPDVVAWLYCPDTPINYPVAQAEDNDYYMHRLLNGKRNYAGTLFMDFRNAANLTDWNTVIYGHNMRNNSMFGSLPNYKQRSYFEKHSDIYLLTPERNYAIRVLAGFVTPNDSELYNALRPEDEKKNALIQSWLDAANCVSDDQPTLDDHLITLSTCSYEYNDARYVLVGILEELSG